MATFATIFQSKPDYSPDAKHADTVQKHRKELGGTLFFDRMWQQLSLGKAGRSYPPKSNAELKDIWKKILEANVSDEQKLGLQYYLIRDCRNNSLEKLFLQKTYLPEKYQILVTGLWELDHIQFSRSLEYLTDPTLLPPTFADDILSVLLRHPKCDQSQAMAYYLTVRPPLQDESTLNAYFDLLSQTNVTAAYNFALGHSQHEALFESLVSSIQSRPPGETRAAAAIQLLGLPLTDEETLWLEDLALDGTAKLPQMMDTFRMKEMVKGRSATGGVARYEGPSIDGVNWQELQRIADG
jgi:hypothetical protein